MSDEDLDVFEDEEEDNLEDMFLSVNVQHEVYAVPVAQVTEIVRLQKIFDVPDMPSYIKGVINLRGKVIPLMDMRERLGASSEQYHDRTVIVVIEHEEYLTGMVVDAVNEVFEIVKDAIAPPPRVREDQGAGVVKGIGKVGQEVVLLLDIDQLLKGSRFEPSSLAQKASHHSA